MRNPQKAGGSEQRYMLAHPVEYVPAKGTVVRVNRAVAVSGAHHELMLAFLDHWLGQRPLSEEIKRTLLGSS